MARYKILLWQQIPSHIRGWDDFDEVSLEPPARFAALIDRTAQEAGLTGTDDFLAQWRWSDEEELGGPPREVAEAVRRRLEADTR